MSIDTVTANAAARIAGAIKQAARSTGISFEYLLTTAQIESSFNPKAEAPTTSAKGLYQFIDQTWLATMKRAGPANGLGQYADAIVQGPDGHYDVPDPRARAEILKLRSDPKVSAMMAAAFTRTNASDLAGAINRQPTDGELYIAHFLGSDGAARLISAAENNPRANAAAMFPAAASANRTIFYDANGHARSVSEVYAKITGRFENARTTALNFGLRGSIEDDQPAPRPPLPIPAAAPAAAAAIPAPVPVSAAAKGPVPDNAAAVAAAVAAAYEKARANPPLPPPAPPGAPRLFESMFTDRVAPLTHTVNSLWADTKVNATDRALAAPPAKPPQGQPLDLFTNGARNTRGLFGAGKV